MQSATQSAPIADPVHGFPFRRLVKDMRYATVLCLMLGVFVTIIEGDGLESLFVHLVLALCIGLLSYLVVDAVRLALLREPDWGAKQWLILLVVVLVTTPISTCAGAALAYFILGATLPAADVLMRDVLITGYTTVCGMFLFTRQERAARIEAAAARERVRAEAVARQATQAQLQLLQAQIEPHMLFNTLANLESLIELDAARASHMLRQLIRYLRATLTSSRAEATTLAQEFGLLDAYLGLMAVRMGMRLRFSLHLPEALAGACVPPMLLQPLVENAIAHGLEPKVGGGELVVSAERRGEALEITVRDSGLGLGRPAARAGSGVGLANTRERLRGLYGERATLALEPAVPHGAVARITLPLELA
jgi:signal transduction histidine kinase